MRQPKGSWEIYFTQNPIEYTESQPWIFPSCTKYNTLLGFESVPKYMKLFNGTIYALVMIYSIYYSFETISLDYNLHC